MELSVKEIAAAVKAAGCFGKDRPITGVEFDSRKVTEGSLFVPLAGVRDGHDFIQQAIENGAKAAFWSKPLKEAPIDIAIIQVAEPLTALQALAHYYVKKKQVDVIAITGSNGKTSTKDMTAAVLAQRFITYKTQGNYNNDIGLPYTILHMPDDTEKLVLEMGMDHFGEIELLSQIAQPSVAAITMIGEAHIENLGSREGIAKAKMEITAGLNPNGMLLIPEQEVLLQPLVQNLVQKIVTFGIDRGSISGHVIDEQAQQTTFAVAGELFTIPVLGAYNVTNALIAYGIGQYFGLTIEEIRQGLTAFQLTQNRTQWLTTENGAAILSDVYNANPTAMGLVIDSFAKLPKNAGKKYLVLADMLALGPDSLAMHAAMAKHIEPTEIAEVFLLGKEMEALYLPLLKKFPEQTVHHYDKEQMPELTEALRTLLTQRDAVLLKGSNGMGLIKVVNALVAK